MGKVRRPRKKLHLESKTAPRTETSSNITNSPFVITPQDDLFGNLNIDITSLSKNLSEDTQSVKSFKSVKSESGKVLTKKDKLKLRREMLLNKFDILNQQKLQNKKKKKPIVGDLSALKDALPSLESLLKNRSDVLYKKVQGTKKQRSIEKSRTIRKNQLQGIKMFQQILKNKQYQKDPQNVISQHLKAVLEQKNM